MKHKNEIFSMRKMGNNILITFICFLLFMFFCGGGTQKVLAAEDEVTITLDANGGKVVEPVVYKKAQSKVGLLPETTRSGYVFNGWWTKDGGTSSSDSAWGSIVKYNSDSMPKADTTYYARWTEDNDKNNKQSSTFYGKADKNVSVWSTNYGHIMDSSEKTISYNYGHVEKMLSGGTYNYGYIDNLIAGNSSLTYNYGKITESQGKVSTNYGTLEKNGATVNTNYGTIGMNTDIVDTNYGTIEKNTGTIKTQNSDILITENSGTINKISKGSVQKNTGTIGDIDNKDTTIYNYAGGTVGKHETWGVEKCTVWNMGGTVQGNSWSRNVIVYNFTGGSVDSLQPGSTIYDLGGEVTNSDKVTVIKCYKVNINNSFVDTWNDKFIINPDTGEAWLPEGETGTFTVKAGTPQLYVTGATLTKQSETAYTLSDAKDSISIDDVEPFTITYDLNGGTVEGNPAVYTERDTFTLKNPTRENYVFVGWTGTDLTEPSDNVTIQKGSTGHRKYTAVWKQDPNIVMVTFAGQNDTEDQVMIYNILTGGDTIGKLPETAKEGYNFLGWFTEKEGGTAITESSKKPHQNTTYYAHWEIGTFTYTLDPNGGTPNSTTKITRVYKESIGLIPVVSREGYIFNGWWSTEIRDDNQEYWVAALQPNSAMKGQDTTYYARWTKRTDVYSDTTGVYLFSSFTGSLRKNTGTVVNNFGLIETNASTVTTNYGEVGLTQTSISANYGHVGTVEDKVVTNYGVIDTVVDTASVRYNESVVKDNHGILAYNNGKIEKNSGIITENNNYIGENTEKVKKNSKGAEIHANKGNVIENLGTVYNYPGGVVQKNSGTLYNFGGKVNEDTTGKVIESYSITLKTGIDEATLNNEAITDLDGKKWLETGKSATITVVWAKGYSADAYHLEAEGCKIVMNDNGTYTLSNIAENAMITAVPNTFKITYDLAGGKLSTANPEEYTFETEDITLVNPEREGYTFKGWISAESSEPETSATIKKGSTGNRIYTAQWEAKIYSITYDLNGGTLTEEVNPKEYTVETEDFTLVNPKKVGYVFKGWVSTESEEAEDTVTIKKGSTGNRAYTAQWEVAKYNITYDLNGATDTANPSSYNYETEDFTLTVPARTGYIFLGWTGTDLAEPTEAVTIKKGSIGNRTYTAVWNKEDYTITYNLNGGTIAEAANPTGYSYETNDFTLAAPVRKGYNFLGWTGTDLAGVAATVTVRKGSVGNRIYTAQWEKQEIFILPKVTVKGKNTQKLSWNKLDEADGYFVYSSVAGKKMKKVLDTKKRSSKKSSKKSSRKTASKSGGSKTVIRTFKKLKASTVYQYQIRAYKLVNGKKKVFCKSMVIYSVANNQSGKLTNVKNIKLKKKSYTLQVRQTVKIKAKYTAYRKNKKLYSHVKTFRYISSNTNIAKVTKTGKIRAVRAGTCTVYVLAPNGVRKAIVVTVK